MDDFSCSLRRIWPLERTELFLLWDGLRLILYGWCFSGLLLRHPQRLFGAPNPRCHQNFHFFAVKRFGDTVTSCTLAPVTSTCEKSRFAVHTKYGLISEVPMCLPFLRLMRIRSASFPCFWWERTAGIVESTVRPFLRISLAQQEAYHLSNSPSVSKRAKPPDSIAIWYLIARIHPAELRKGTAIDDLHHRGHV